MSGKRKKSDIILFICGWMLVFPLLVFIVSAGCENPITGYGPQPDYFDGHEHQPMLNVFGVLRPDTLNGRPLSFIHLEKSYPVTDDPDTVEVTEAEVVVYQYDDDIVVDSMVFMYTDFDSTFSRHEYRHADFFPTANRTYGLICRSEGFPSLVSRTTVPSPPVILEEIYSENTYSFTILRDSSVALYDMYVWAGGDEYFRRVLRPDTGNVRIAIDVTVSDGTEGYLLVYAYDLKLSEYMTYNVNYKLNTYRSDYSTVENGYGCFGSLNYTSKNIIFLRE